MIFLILFLSFFRSSLGDITCGDGGGDSTSDWFNKLKCGSFKEGLYGAACADDFNVWCCPRNYGCSGSFADPGGNNHCQTKDKFSGDCTYCPNQPDTVLKTKLGVCLNTGRYGRCKLELLNYKLNESDFVVPDTSTRCKFYCCPGKGQYCIDEGCVR